MLKRVGSPLKHNEYNSKISEMQDEPSLMGEIPWGFYYILFKYDFI